MGDDAIAAYLRQLAEALRRAGRPTQPLVDEAAAHLSEDAARIAAADGCGDAEAARRAVDRFGSIDEVVRSVRRNARFGAAALARLATIVLYGAIALEIVEKILWHDFAWPPTVEWLWLSFGVELVLVSVALRRALAGGRVAAWLRLVLALQGAVAFACFVAVSAETLRFSRYWTNVNPFLAAVGIVPPLWLAMTVQAAAGLRALSQRAATGEATARAAR